MNALRNLAAALLLPFAAAGAQPERITFPEAVQRALVRNASVQIALQEICWPRRADFPNAARRTG